MVTVRVHDEPAAFVPRAATFRFRLVPESELEFEIDHSFQAKLPSPEAHTAPHVTVYAVRLG